jgi:hypothetical protein
VRRPGGLHRLRIHDILGLELPRIRTDRRRQSGSQIEQLGVKLTYTASKEYLQELIAALREQGAPSRPISKAILSELEGIAVSGWVLKSSLEDLVMALDRRLYCYGAGDPDRLIGLFGLRWQQVTFRPKAIASQACLHEALSAGDFAFLLIQLEEMGFQVDPSPLVSRLLSSWKKASMLNQQELVVFWHSKTKGRNFPLRINAAELESETGAFAFADKLESWKTTTGYRVELWGDEEHGVIRLEAHAPRYRNRPAPVETKCPDCGYTYYRGDPESSSDHRKEHRKRMHFLAPVPHAKFLVERETENNPELVTSASPGWKHREMYIRAQAFRREFRYDFVQWQSTGGDNDPMVRGLLFGNEDGAIVGACAFRRRNDLWGLQWVWFSPRHRRQGHLARRWEKLRETFGDFQVETPVSLEMQRFLAKQGDSGLIEGSSRN